MIRGTHTEARPEAMTPEEFDAALMHGLATPGPLGLALVSALLDLPVKGEVPLVEAPKLDGSLDDYEGPAYDDTLDPISPNFDITRW